MFRVESIRKYQSPIWMENFVRQHKYYLQSNKHMAGVIVPTEGRSIISMTVDGFKDGNNGFTGNHGQNQDKASHSGKYTIQNGMAPQPFPRRYKEGGIKSPMYSGPRCQMMTQQGLVEDPSKPNFYSKEMLERNDKKAPVDIQLRREIECKERVWRQKTEEKRFDAKGNLQPVNANLIYELEMGALRNAEKPLRSLCPGPFMEIMLMVQGCVKKAMRMRIDRRAIEKHCLKSEVEYEKIIFAKLFSEERKMLQEHIKYLQTIYYMRDGTLEMTTKRIWEIMEDITKPLVIKIESGLGELDALGLEAPFPVDLLITVHHLATVLEELQKMEKYPLEGGATMDPIEQSINTGDLRSMAALKARKKEFEGRKTPTQGGMFHYTLASQYCKCDTTNKEEEVREVPPQKEEKQPSQNSEKQLSPRTTNFNPKSLMNVDKYIQDMNFYDSVLRNFKRNIKFQIRDENQFRTNVIALHSCGFGIYESASLLSEFSNRPELVIEVIQQAVYNGCKT